MALRASAIPYVPVGYTHPRTEIVKRPVGIHWANVIYLAFNAKMERAPISKHSTLYKLLRLEYTSNPGLFTLTSEGHHSEDGRYYCSFIYHRKNENGHYASANLHIYGRDVGFKFVCESMDILMADGENYYDAVIFVKHIPRA